MAAKRASKTNGAAKVTATKTANGKRHRAGLSEELLVATALRIIERVGTTGLSTRVLAAELGVTQMALYYHVSSREDLLARALDRLLADIEIPPPDFGTWDERLRRRTEVIIERLQSYPGVGDLLLGPAVPFHATRVVRDVIKMLADEGFDREQIRFIYSSVGLWMMGRLAYDARARLDPGVKAAQLGLIPVPAGTPDADWGLSPSEFSSLQLAVLIEGVRVAVGEPAARRRGPALPPTISRSAATRSSPAGARRQASTGTGVRSVAPTAE